MSELEDLMRINILETLQERAEKTRDNDIAELYNELETVYLNQKEEMLENEDYFDFLDSVRIEHDYAKARELVQEKHY